MASGLPVLGSALGGVPELIDPVPALAPDHIAAWSEALAELWNAPEARQRRGEENLAAARVRFGEDRYHEALMRVYAA
jgi:glycosyltransferase involved in cell wall biosynthesis